MTFTKILRAALVAAVLCGDAAVAADYELISAVIVSRHGVRSPTETHPPLATIAAEPWPSWPVPPGHLTPRGAELATLLGAYYREHYAAQGLLPAQGCPQPGDVYAWADLDQRTRVTAEALLKGMFPGCDLQAGYLTGAKLDPLFHPTGAGVCRIDLARTRQAVLDRVGTLTALRKKYQGEIAAMQSVLKCCGPKVCRAAGATGSCALGDLPTKITVSHHGARAHLSGPIAIGSTAAEVFLLGYAQGFPADQVAWGRASTPDAMRPLMRLHTLSFDLMERTPYLAARQGSALVQRIVASLRSTVGGATAADASSAGRKLTLLVGHDTNLAAIGGMLGLHWSLPSYLADQTPPAGALHFELLRDRQSKAYAVRVRYIAQTLDQMRQATRLDLAHPPEQATATIDGCAPGDDGTCAWRAFEALASKAIDRACVGTTSR